MSLKAVCSISPDILGIRKQFVALTDNLKSRTKKQYNNQEDKSQAKARAEKTNGSPNPTIFFLSLL